MSSLVGALPLVAGLISIGLGLTWCRQQEQVHQSVADPVLTLIDRAERTVPLQNIVKQSDKSISTYRAKYILATEAIAEQQSDRAVAYLAGLEQDYPVLTPQIIWKRAQAYQLAGNKVEFNSQLQLLVTAHSKSPVVVEAWNILGETDERYWDLAIDKFPSHPRTLEIIQKKLAQTPNLSKLLLILAQYYDDNDRRRLKVADKLVTEYPNDLKPSDWDTIGLIYWNNKAYNKVMTPLKRGTKNPSNAYKIAQGHLWSKQPAEAKAMYQEIIDRYPQTPEAVDSLVNLADLSPSIEALTYVDRVIEKFPSQSAKALAKKAEVLERSQNLSGAAAARAQMVKLHPHTEEVAAYRWQLARAAAKSGNFDAAWALAKQIVTDTPYSKYSPRAAFWIGKWAQKLGKFDDAKRAFAYTFANYNDDYYSWRAARYLGWDVGDFDTIRSLNPTIVKPNKRLPLPNGSPALKELYSIGQDTEAWELWQCEFINRQEPTTIERITQGILQNGLAKNFDRQYIKRKKSDPNNSYQQEYDNTKYISSVVELIHLEEERKTANQAEFTKMRQQQIYAETLYPLPLFFTDIIKSVGNQQQVNPLLVISVIRQESKFSPIIKSPVGALGLMQVIPDTAKFAAYKLGLNKYELTEPQDNIRLGTWYLHFTHGQVKDHSVLAIAGYNAGPGNVTKWVKEFGTADFDEFIEEIPFDETQNYVKNVLGNYWNYLRLYHPATIDHLKKTPH